MIIQITDGSSVHDPTDVAPIYVWGIAGREEYVPVNMAARGWRARLSIWLLRRHVQRCVGSR
jgi:hypothetical protein